MISQVKPLNISKITDLIKPEILALILKGLCEEKRALIIEEMDGEEIDRIPLPEEILSRYWTNICGYINRFPTGKNACENNSKNLAKKIIQENIQQPDIHTCPLGLKILSIPFAFKGKVIGVLFGGKKRFKGTDINKPSENL